MREHLYIRVLEWPTLVQLEYFLLSFHNYYRMRNRRKITRIHFSLSCLSWITWQRIRSQKLPGIIYIYIYICTYKWEKMKWIKYVEKINRRKIYLAWKNILFIIYADKYFKFKFANTQSIQLKIILKIKIRIR